VLGQLLSSKQPAESVDQTKQSIKAIEQKDRQKRVWRLTIAGLALIVVPTIVAISLGAQAVSDRELPLVTLQAAPVAAASSAANAGAGAKADTIEITVTARAVGMSTQNDLLVQVVGLYVDPAESTTGLPLPTPSGSVTPSPVPGLAVHQAQVGMCESNHVWGPEFNRILDPARAKLLMWDRVGPKADGTIDMTWKVLVPAGQFAYVCAWAPVGGPGKRYASSASYLRLK
jgi:hypothetical protein